MSVADVISAALACAVPSALEPRSVGELCFGPAADLDLLQQVAERGAPSERAAAITILSAIGRPVELDLDDQLLVHATTLARVDR